VRRAPCAVAALLGGLLVGSACPGPADDCVVIDLSLGVHEIDRPEAFGMVAGTIELVSVDDPVTVEYTEADTGANVTVTYTVASVEN